MSIRRWPIHAQRFSRLLLSTLLIGTQSSGLGWSSLTPRPTAPGSATVPAPDQATRARLSAAYGNLPLTFEANQGQTDPQVQFLARGASSTLFLTPTEAVLTLTTGQRSNTSKGTSPVLPPPTPETARVLRMTFVGANPAPHLAGRAALPGTANYFLGNDPTRWHTHIPTYKQVKYEQVYPGVDVVYYGTQGHFEYDCVVAAGADPSAITLGFAGADKIEINSQGELVVHLPSGAPLRWHPPVMYQEVNGLRQAVSGGYVLLAPPRATGQADKGSYQVGFAVGDYDATRPLVIDPVLSYSTYLGGRGVDGGLGIAVDLDGNAYVTGETRSFNFPTTPKAFQPTFGGGGNDAFVTKVTPDGTALVYSTYLGGRGEDYGHGIAVDADGAAYVTGETRSPNFPTTPGAFQPTFSGVVNAFVTKVNPDGTALVYSTYLRGGNYDFGYGIAVDADGNAYVTGETQSPNFPTTPKAFQRTYGGSVDAFVTQVNPDGTALVYSSYLGGRDDDVGYGIAVDLEGTAYVTGQTTSPSFPTTPGVFQTTFGGPADAFVTKVNPQGTALMYSTYLGGRSADAGLGIAVDQDGTAYVTGVTTSPNFPTTPGAFQPTFGGGIEDAFVTQVNPRGTALIYSTYLGGSVADRGSGIAVDAEGTAYVTGQTNSFNFPTTPKAFQTTFGGGFDAFVTQVNPAGTALIYSTYLGGRDDDSGNGIAVDQDGTAYVTGLTASRNFPTTPKAFQPTFGGDLRDAFIAKISP